MQKNSTLRTLPTRVQQQKCVNPHVNRTQIDILVELFYTRKTLIAISQRALDLEDAAIEAQDAYEVAACHLDDSDLSSDPIDRVATAAQEWFEAAQELEVICQEIIDRQNRITLLETELAEFQAGNNTIPIAAKLAGGSRR